jgi:hypothetical protein
MTSAGTTGRTAVDRGDSPNGDHGDEADWPVLRAADRCDGENPTTGQACINGHHHGYHRDTSGAEWLDD